MVSLYNQLDGFGNIYGFTYDGDARFKTCFGATLSLLMALASIGIFLNFLFEFLDRSSPRVDVTYQKNVDPDRIVINSSLAFILKKNGQPWLSDKLELKMFNSTINDGNFFNQKYEEIELVPCNPELFTAEPEEYELYKLSEASCLPFKEFHITGAFISKTFNYLSMQLRIKDGLSEAEQLELHKELTENKVYLHVFFEDHSNDFKLPGNPITEFTAHEEIRLNFKEKGYLDLYFQPGKVESVDTYIFFMPDVNEYYEANLDVDKKLYRSRHDNEMDIAEINFKASITYYETKRYYGSFAEMVANIVSLINALSVGLRIISFFYSKTEFYFNLLNNFTILHRIDRAQNYDFLSLNKKIKFQKKIDIKESLSKVELKEHETNNTNIQIQASHAKFKRIQFKTHIGNLFSLTFCRCFGFMGRKFQEKIDFFNQGLTFFEKHIGFESFMENMRQFALIKKFLLDERQREIIDKLSGIIFIDEFNSTTTIDEKRLTRKSKSETSDINILKSYATSIQSSEENTVFDKNFVNYFGKFFI